MFQFAFVRVLFRFTYPGPSFVPLFALPPTSATAPRHSPSVPFLIFTFSIVAVLTGDKSPGPPGGYAAKGILQERPGAKLQYASARVLVRLTYPGPSFGPKLAAPPTSATATISGLM